MGFQKCPIATACLGYAPSQSNASSIANASSLVHRQFAQGSLASLLEDNSAQALSQVGDPDRDERCSEGYRGVLCASCAPGFTRWGKYECRQCLDGSLVITSAVGLTLLVLGMIAYLTMNAVKASLESDIKLDVAAVKIGFSFFQTVSIAASFDLRWPESVRTLFSSMSAVTSVSADVFSMDCMLQSSAAAGKVAVSVPHGSLFLARSAVMLAIPFVLVFIALFFWLVAAPGCGCLLDRCADSYYNQRSASKTKKPVSFSSISSSPLESPKEGDSKESGGVDGLVVNPMLRIRPSKRTLPASATDKPSVLKKASKKREARLTQMFEAQVIHKKTVSRKMRKLVFGDKHVDVELSVTQRVILTVVVMLFMIHMSVTKASLELLTCQSLGQLGKGATRLDGTDMPPGEGGGGCSTAEAVRRVSGDLELCCTESSVQTFTLGLGIPAMLIYAIGIPVGAFVLLWLNRQQLNNRRVRATLGFLYTGYRPEAYYWETVVMVRKALIASIAVFLAPFGASIQTYASILLVVSLMMLQLGVRPFRFEALNRLEMGSLLSAFVTFECGLFLTDPNTSETIRVIATMGVFVVNLVTLLGVVGVIIWSQGSLRRLWSRRIQTDLLGGAKRERSSRPSTMEAPQV
jgi:hypothetical protein